MTVAWPVILLGTPIAVLLWHRTSRDPAPHPADGLQVVAVALACTAVVATRPLAQAAVVLPLAVAGGAAACVDAREGRLPDALTLTLAPATLCGVVLIAGDLTAAMAFAAIGTVAAVVVKIADDTVLGWGDVKLAPALAITLSQGGSVLAFGFCAAVLLTLTALLVRLTDEGGDVVPYGPALVLGAIGAAAA